MRLLLERWCEWRGGVRCLCWAVGSLAILLGAYWALAHPVLSRVSRLEAQRDHSSVTLRALRVSVGQQSVLPAIPETAPFSALSFQHHGSRLVRWQPNLKGGELTLEADWGQIPAIFAQLAQQGVGISTFTVEPDKSRLRLVVSVEGVDAK